ncbi:hypothetical protein PR202_gb28912 [Eleusine coracana subsp. coracana]|uniref:Uncharacterized protein n=1 Tax=Eleusine coracana subsp. coracana TaxID=191504 RepID=A0AAV5FYJ0_ELECO|nr:hypothetical protein PR202_gb28912 [Eleusine coracana subsp. coracana]
MAEQRGSTAIGHNGEWRRNGGRGWRRNGERIRAVRVASRLEAEARAAWRGAGTVASPGGGGGEVEAGSPGTHPLYGLLVCECCGSGSACPPSRTEPTHPRGAHGDPGRQAPTTSLPLWSASFLPASPVNQINLVSFLPLPSLPSPNATPRNAHRPPPRISPQLTSSRAPPDPDQTPSSDQSPPSAPARFDSGAPSGEEARSRPPMLLHRPSPAEA